MTPSFRGLDDGSQLTSPPTSRKAGDPTDFCKPANDNLKSTRPPIPLLENTYGSDCAERISNNHVYRYLPTSTEAKYLYGRLRNCREYRNDCVALPDQHDFA